MIPCWLATLWLIRQADETADRAPAWLARHWTMCPPCRARHEAHVRLARQLAAAVPQVEPSPFLAARLAAVVRGGAAARAGHSWLALRLAGLAALLALSVWLVAPPRRPAGPVAESTVPSVGLAAIVDATLAEPARLTDDPRLAVVRQALDEPLQQEFQRLLADAGSAWRSLAADFSPSPAGP